MLKKAVIHWEIPDLVRHCARFDRARKVNESRAIHRRNHSIPRVGCLINSYPLDSVIQRWNKQG